jgi:hypothetical protein|nr:MAG TPA: hypothetical protein [Caudoviricetes sp.]
MDLEVELFNPRRVICEAVKITEENYQQVRAPDRGTALDSLRATPALTTAYFID